MNNLRSRPSLRRALALRAVVAVVALLSGACGGTPQAPPRSPSHDYPAPPAEGANGEVVGADRQAPADKLATGPTVGSEGVKPAAEPPSHKGASKNRTPKP